jgi:hypothetical protein
MPLATFHPFSLNHHTIKLRIVAMFFWHIAFYKCRLHGNAEAAPSKFNALF